MAPRRVDSTRGGAIQPIRSAQAKAGTGTGTGTHYSQAAVAGSTPCAAALASMTALSQAAIPGSSAS